MWSALYTGYLLCGNETQDLLLCSLPFAACYSRGTKPPCCTESRRCTGTRHETKATPFSKWCQPFVSLSQCFFPTWRIFTTWMTTIRDKSSWRPCLKRVLLSTISFIYYFILFYAVNPPSPESMLCVVKDRRVGLQNNFRRGEGVHRGEG